MKMRTVVIGLGVLILLVLALYTANRMRPEEIPATQVTRKDVVATVTVTGEVRGDRLLELSTPDQAKILSMAVDDGDSVTVGQPLVQLDVSDVQGQIVQAQGNLEASRGALAFQLEGTRQEEVARLKAAFSEAQQRLEEAKFSLSAQEAQAHYAKQQAQRMEKLFQQEFISAQQRDEAVMKADAETRRQEQLRVAVSSASSQVAQAKANMERWVNGPSPSEIHEARGRVESAQGAVGVAKAQLNHRILTSPISGVVIKRLMEPGETATPGKPILRLLDVRAMEVVAFVEEPDLQRIAPGQGVFVVLDALPDLALKGKIRQIGHEVNADNGTVEVKVDLVDGRMATLPKGTLLPGMTADINIVSPPLKQAMVIPATAAFQQKGKWFVYVFEGSTLKARSIQFKRMTSEWIHVLKGLAPGEWVADLASETLASKPRVTPKVKAAPTQ